MRTLINNTRNNQIYITIKAKLPYKNKYLARPLSFPSGFIQNKQLQFHNHFIKGMKNKRQRQEPFHVRRVRMKQSIIKSNQMLENLTLSDHNLQKFRAITEPTRQEEESPQIKRKMTYNSSMVNEIDLLNLRLNKAQFNHIKFAVQLSKNNRYKKAQSQMQQNGLEAIKIQARQSVKKILQSKQHQCLCKISSESQKKSRNAKLKTLRNVSPQPQLLKKNTSVERFRLKSTLANDSEQKTNRMFNEEEGNSMIKMEKINLSPFGKEKTRRYLYQKMALSESKQRDRSNLIYQKRIKSYTDFIWKLLLAHNVFLDIDLSSKWSPPKLKFFIGKGNNCNMIKGLLKRRFWWSISEQFTEECSFVWTQIKIDKIYERQEVVYESLTEQIKQNEKHLQSLLTSSNKKLPPYLIKSLKRGERERFKHQYSQNKKIWNTNDFQLFQRFFLSRKQRINKDESQQDDKDINYRQSTQKIRQGYKNIIFIDNLQNLSQVQSQQNHNYYRIKPIIHNHLQNNFLLGNKKALFYNLKEYYDKIGEDLFQYIPLTFHIKRGFKDPEYKKFVNYFHRAKTLNKDIQEKQRNIWIVKPGQNSNRGNGIIVIDQIYEFDNLIRKSDKRTRRSGSNDAQSPQTYIMQKYIDRPFLYNERKFDIRHYILMTNLYGVTRAYWYEQGYIRTSAYPFDIDNFQAHIHLTNDAVQVNYPDYGKYESHNKISYNQFQSYLNNQFPEKKYNFKEQVLPQMKKMATDAAKSVYLKISSKQQMHNFEIFGLDFMIDKKFKPWLIQINTNPCLQCQCPLLNRIIPYVVEQSLKLSIDLIYPPPSHYPSLWKHDAPLVDLETFKYELIFDSLYEGQTLKKLYSDNSNAQFNLNDIGLLQTDECFRNDGKEIKLQDYT